MLLYIGCSGNKIHFEHFFSEFINNMIISRQKHLNSKFCPCCKLTDVDVSEVAR